MPEMNSSHAGHKCDPKRRITELSRDPHAVCYVTERGEPVTFVIPPPCPRTLYTHTPTIARAVPAHLLTPGVYLYLVRRLVAVEDEWIARRDRIMAERAGRPSAGEDDPFAVTAPTADDYPPTPRHVLAALDTFRLLTAAADLYLDPAELAVAEPVASLPEVTFRAPDSPWVATPQTDGNLTNWWWDEPTDDQLATMQARADHLRRVARGEVPRTPRPAPPVRTMTAGGVSGGKAAQTATPAPTPTPAGTPRTGKGKKRKPEPALTGGLFADA